MQYLIVSPLGESFETSSSNAEELRKEIESKLAYKVSSQNLVLENLNSNLRQRRNNPPSIYSSNLSQAASEEEHGDPPKITVLVNPTWFPSFIEAYLSLMRSICSLIILSLEKRFDFVKTFSSQVRNFPRLLTLLNSFIFPIISNSAILIFGACIMGICAQISIALPHSISAVPITGQTFGVLWLGSLLGFILAPLSIMLYLFCGGVLEIPWFANHGYGNQILFQSATSGFLIGFVFSALVCGWACSKLAADRTILMNLLMLSLSNGMTFVFGCGWLSLYGTAPMGFSQSISKGLVPFLPGELIKICFVLVMVRVSWLALFMIRKQVLRVLEEKKFLTPTENQTISSTLNNIENGFEEIPKKEVNLSIDEEDNRCLSTASIVSINE